MWYCLPSWLVQAAGTVLVISIGWGRTSGIAKRSIKHNNINIVLSSKKYQNSETNWPLANEKTSGIQGTRVDAIDGTWEHMT